MTGENRLEVLLYSEPVGTLTRFSGDRTRFNFSDDYIADDNRPLLGLGFRDGFGGLMTTFRSYQTRVMPFFSNLLPEGRMRSYLAGRAAVNPDSEFFLLWVLGLDLPGAITVRPVDGEAWLPGERDDADGRREALRFSLSGVQLKFPAITEDGGGLTIPAKGVGGSWIIKLPSPHFDGMIENEYSMMTLARSVGIDVPAIRLVDVDTVGNLPDGLDVPTGRALAIERFDRLEDGSSVHMEDFAQVFELYPEQKYRKARMRHIARVVRAECSEADVRELIRRLVFNMLVGNADMHTKNWSLIYPDRRSAALAPAYDFVSTLPYLQSTKAALRISRTRRFAKFSRSELCHLAAKARLPERLVLSTASETLGLFHERWQADKANLPLGSKAVRAIDEHLKQIPLVSDGG